MKQMESYHNSKATEGIDHFLANFCKNGPAILVSQWKLFQGNMKIWRVEVRTRLGWKLDDVVHVECKRDCYEKRQDFQKETTSVGFFPHFRNVELVSLPVPQLGLDSLFSFHEFAALCHIHSFFLFLTEFNPEITLLFVSDATDVVLIRKFPFSRTTGPSDISCSALLKKSATNWL